MANDFCTTLRRAPMHPICVEVIRDKPREGLYGMEKLVHQAPRTLNPDVAKSDPSTPSTGNSSNGKHVGKIQPSTPEKNTVSTIREGAPGTIAKAVEDCRFSLIRFFPGSLELASVF